MIVAIDPGEVHCGWAEYRTYHSGLYCARVIEYHPDEAVDLLWSHLIRMRDIETVVIEEFRLYPDRAAEQTGSTFPTVEQIGQVKWLCRVYQTQLVTQPAAIIRPTISVLRKRGLSSRAVAEGAGIHAKEAEIHGAHYLLRQPGETLLDWRKMPAMVGAAGGDQP